MIKSSIKACVIDVNELVKTNFAVIIFVELVPHVLAELVESGGWIPMLSKLSMQIKVS